MDNIKEKDKKYFQKIITLIDNNEIEKAKGYLKVIAYVPYKDFFYNRITEKELSKEIKEKYLDVGRYALEIEEYDVAYDYFKAGLYLSENPLFYYYLGKLFYKLDMLTTSSNYLNKYRFTGSLKLNKCYFYLFLICKMKNCKTANKYFAKYNDINEFLEIEFKTRNPNRTKNRNRKRKEEKIIAEIFSNNKEEKIASCDKEDLKEQLEYIKNLLLQRKEKEANKLLRNLKAETKEEKQLIKQLENNKKLYLNKSK